MGALALYPYQKVGARWLAARRRALLADAPGVGKSAQAIEACNIVGASRVAVVCPAIARINWRREFDRWSFYGPELKVDSYNRLALDRALRREWAAWRPDVLIVDEAHMAKEPSAARTKALYGPHCRGDGLVRVAGRVWLLTGTPTPNDASELFPHARALWPEILPGAGTFADWLARYTAFIQGPHGPKVLANRNVAELRAALGPHMLRRTVEEVLPDLPPVFTGELAVENDEALEEVRALEQTVEVQELVYRLDSGAPIPEADPHLAAFRRVCGLAKAGPVAGSLALELEAGAIPKVVVFAHHRDVIERVAEGLHRFNPVRVWGGDSDRVRQVAIDRFQNDPTVRVFIGQITACSTAVTLTAAHHCVFLEQSWVPAENEQAVGRLKRISQKSTVLCRIAVLAGSIDEAVARTLARKTLGLNQLYGDRG